MKLIINLGKDDSVLFSLFPQTGGKGRKFFFEAIRAHPVGKIGVGMLLHVLFYRFPLTGLITNPTTPGTGREQAPERFNLLPGAF